MLWIRLKGIKTISVYPLRKFREGNASHQQIRHQKVKIYRHAEKIVQTKSFLSFSKINSNIFAVLPPNWWWNIYILHTWKAFFGRSTVRSFHQLFNLYVRVKINSGIWQLALISYNESCLCVCANEKHSIHVHKRRKIRKRNKIIK